MAWLFTIRCRIKSSRSNTIGIPFFLFSPQKTFDFFQFKACVPFQCACTRTNEFIIWKGLLNNMKSFKWKYTRERLTLSFSNLFILVLLYFLSIGKQISAARRKQEIFYLQQVICMPDTNSICTWSQSLYYHSLINNTQLSHVLICLHSDKYAVLGAK